MNEVVYKFDVMPLYEAEGIKLPKSAKIVSVLHQHNEETLDCGVKIYILLDPDNTDLETRYFYFVGTGSTLPSGKKIPIGTVQDPSGFVWHVFEALHG